MSKASFFSRYHVDLQTIGLSLLASLLASPVSAVIAFGFEVKLESKSGGGLANYAGVIWALIFFWAGGDRVLAGV